MCASLSNGNQKKMAGSCLSRFNGKGMEKFLFVILPSILSFKKTLRPHKCVGLKFVDNTILG